MCSYLTTQIFFEKFKKAAYQHSKCETEREKETIIASIVNLCKLRWATDDV